MRASRSPSGESASRLALGALTIASAIALALLADAPPFRQEGIFLSLLMVAPLLATLLLMPHGRTLAVPVAALPLLLLLALAALPPGPPRGAALGLLLALALAISASLALTAGPSLARWSLFALGSSGLFQARRLLAPELDPALAAHLLVLPLLGALAAAILSRRHGGAVALTLVTLGLLATGGWSPTLVAGLWAVAAILELVAGPMADPPRIAPVPLLAAASIQPPLWGFGAGVAVTLGALAPLLGRLWPALLLVAGALLVLLGEPLPWRTVLPLAGLVVVGSACLWLLPADSLRPFGRARGLASALALLGVTARTLPVEQTLTAVVLVLLAAAVKPGGRAGTPNGRALATPRQALLLAFHTVLLTLALAHATYPWLRTESALGRLVHNGLPAVAPVSARLLSWPPVTLHRGEPTWTADFPEESSSSDVTVFVDSTLTNAAALETGTVVARVALEGESEGSSIPQEWLLRAGIETSEWAAARRDLRERPGAEPWLSWVDSSGDFFGQRYRARLDAPPVDVPGAARLRVTLEPGLPEDCQLTLFSVFATSR